MNARASHWLRRPRAASCAVALTVAACLTALVFRTPIRSRYWAWRVVHADSPTQRSVLIGALCAAGDGGRWGTDVLLKHAAGEVRQYGVLVLQHVKTEWARARLLERLGDLDPDVQRLAAVGLAMHHDDAVIPALQSLYRTGDQSSAHAACWAFEYLGTQAAIAAMSDLARDPAEPPRRAALVDALAGVGVPDCVPALLTLLSDERECARPLRLTEMAGRALAGLQGEGRVSPAASLPTAGPVPGTIAERAAAALARITGLDPPFTPDLSAEHRDQAKNQWRAWYAEH